MTQPAVGWQDANPVDCIRINLLMLYRLYLHSFCANQQRHLPYPDLAIALAEVAVLYEEKENGMGTLLDCVDLRPYPSGRPLFQEADHIKSSSLRLEGEHSAPNGGRRTSVCGSKPKTSNGEFARQ